MVGFRNKYVAHRELNYYIPVPLMDRALEVAYIYDGWIRSVISPDCFEEPPLKESIVELQSSIKPFVTRLLIMTKQYKNT